MKTSKGSDMFLRFREYVAYMDRLHPNKPRLNYRDWLDFGHVK